MGKCDKNSGNGKNGGDGKKDKKDKHTRKHDKVTFPKQNRKYLKKRLQLLLKRASQNANDISEVLVMISSLASSSTSSSSSSSDDPGDKPASTKPSDFEGGKDGRTDSTS